MDIDDAIIGRKRFAANLEAVESEVKIADGELACVVGSERAMELEGIVGEFDRGFERKAVGAGDFEAELSGVALGHDGESKQEKSDVKQPAHSDWGNVYATSFAVRAWVTKGIWERLSLNSVLKRRHPEEPAFLPAGRGISRGRQHGSGDPSLRLKNGYAQSLP